MSTGPSKLDETNDVFELLPYQWKGDEERKTSTYFRCRFARDIKILCFSKTCDNPLLWGHYADKGKGICLGFCVNDKSKDTIFEVQYETCRIGDDYRVPAIGILNEISSVLPHGLVKSYHWAYEKEWRMWGNEANLKLDPVSNKYFFPFENRLTLCEILIGPRCPNREDMKSRLVKLVVDYPDPPKIFFTDLSSSTFEIEKVT